MIRRLLCWIADRFADSEWLAKMRDAEMEANRSAVRHEQEREAGPIEDTIFPNWKGRK